MSAPGLFAEWQPRYAERGIATFPVREKKPAVKSYLKIGLPASREFATRFAAEDAFGLACRRNRITVLDVDAPNERLLVEALEEFGPTPFVVRSASGHYQAWYRNNGEDRRIRPDPRRPIDVLGHGFVVAPPSCTRNGAYALISGNLDDLATLPPMRRLEPPTSANDLSQLLDESRPRIETGRRNNELWRHCMKGARHAGNITALMEDAVRFNAAEFYEPLPAEEVLKVVACAWGKEVEGANWFGRGGRVVFDTVEVDDLLHSDPDAFVLLTILRRHHWGRQFCVANAMADSMPGGGWPRKRFAGARRRLLGRGLIEELRRPSKGRAGLYHFKGGRI